MSSKVNILIIGGGAAGFSTAKGLSDALDPANFQITLVTERNYHIHYPALFRVVVTSEGHLENRAIVPYDRLFKLGRPGQVVIGTVEKIRDGEAILLDGRTLPYDWLVLATGSSWEGPLSLPSDEAEAIQFINAWRSKIAKAKNIVMIGGGAVGIEFAGEIRHYYPDTNVTIVHSGKELINDAYPSKFRNATLDALKKIGVKVILGDRLDMPAEPYTSVVTHNGVKLDADLVIPGRGGKVNTRFLKTFDSSILAETGSVKVLPNLRVPLANGKQNVYALGDIIEWSEQKALAKVPSQAAVVVANLLSALKQEEPAKVYSGFMEALSLPFGPERGITYLALLWGITLGNWATSKMKGQYLFIDKTRTALGY